MTLGEDVHPHTVEEAISLQLAEDSAMLNAMEIDLPDNVVPWDDVFVGDP